MGIENSKPSQDAEEVKNGKNPNELSLEEKQETLKEERKPGECRHGGPHKGYFRGHLTEDPTKRRCTNCGEEY